MEQIRNSTLEVGIKNCQTAKQTKDYKILAICDSCREEIDVSDVLPSYERKEYLKSDNFEVVDGIRIYRYRRLTRCHNCSQFGC